MELRLSSNIIFLIIKIISIVKTKAKVIIPKELPDQKSKKMAVPRKIPIFTWEFLSKKKTVKAQIIKRSACSKNGQKTEQK